MGACGSSTAQDEQQHAPPARRHQPTRREQQPRNHASFASSVVGWDKEFPALTAAQLQSKRLEFWETRVQGRAECWQTIRVAVESAEADAGDMATALVILESAEMTPLDVERPDVCFTYDSKGFKYEVPLYCLFQPANLVRETPAKPANSQPLQVQPAPQRPPSADASAGEKQGVAVAAASAKSLKFKIRFSNGLSDLSVEQRTSCSIGQLKALIHESHAALTPDRLRIYYLGKHMSQDRWNLGEIGMKKEMVLQCFIPGVKSQ